MLKRTLFSCHLLYALCFCHYVNSAPLHLAEASDTSSQTKTSSDYTAQDIRWYSGFNLTLGAAYKIVYFEVSERGSNVKQGTLTNDGQTSPRIIVTTPFYYFTDPDRLSLGWFIETGYSSFEVNKQAVGKYLNEVDMGTSVKGQYVYIVPVLFYNWGDAYIKNGRGVSFKFGLGPGLGYLQAKGNIVLTETSNKIENVDVNEYGGAIAIVLDLRINNLLMRLFTGGPSPSSGNRVYSLREESFEVGYSFTF